MPTPLSRLSRPSVTPLSVHGVRKLSLAILEVSMQAKSTMQQSSCLPTGLSPAMTTFSSTKAQLIRSYLLASFFPKSLRPLARRKARIALCACRMATTIHITSWQHSWKNTSFSMLSASRRRHHKHERREPGKWPFLAAVRAVAGFFLHRCW